MIRFYMDEHVDGAITKGLRSHGVDVLTVQEDGYSHTDDALILDHALELGRVVFTQDTDFLVLAADRQAAGIPFAGVIFAAQQRVPVGTCIEDLTLIAEYEEWADYRDRVEYLPLR